MGKMYNSRNKAVSQSRTFDSLTLGTVMDTNDPQQMGRLKICCPSYGDDPSSASADHLPWATYVSPLGGMVNNPGMTRGPNEGSSSAGPLAYGMFGTPRLGATVLVACVDGNPYYRVWMGAVFDQGVVNTLPHGRFFYNGGVSPDGPLNAYEQPIEPLYSNWTKAFGGRSNNFEWATRGGDYSVGSNTSDFVDGSPSDKVDEDSNGYASNRLPGASGMKESSVFSWTSPGFHSISMDDRPENCRMRFRTASGTQVILDDTNERIYIATAEGANYIELDFDGNIDVYAKTRINLHAENDINFTSDKSVRINGKEGVYITGQEVAIEATGNASLKGAVAFVEADGAMNLKAGAEIIVDGQTVDMHGVAAQSAPPAQLTNRIPQHEPWPRGTLNEKQQPKFAYDDPAVGREDKERGALWRR